MERKIYRRVRIYLNEADFYTERPLYLVILEKLKGGQIQGATVIRALTGFGKGGKIKPIESQSLTKMPLIIEAVDEPEKIFQVLPAIENLAQDSGCGVLITIETVEAFRISAY